MSFGVNFVNELDKKFWLSEHKNKIVEYVNHYLKEGSGSRYNYNQISISGFDSDAVKLEYVNHRIRHGEGDGTDITPEDITNEAMLKINSLISGAVLSIQLSLKELSDKDKEVMKELESVINKYKDVECPKFTILLLETRDALNKLKIEYKNLED